MKKYLLLGLCILLGSNALVLSGVAYNRMEEKSQLTLTERELFLPYNQGAIKENSGILLRLKWRLPTPENAPYSPYSPKEIKTDEEELITLGFSIPGEHKSEWAQTRELYWALEFDGDIHKKEVKKAEDAYRTATLEYQENPSKRNKQYQKRSQTAFEKEKVNNSRLFFIQASKSYDALASKYAGLPNILIVKGLSKPYFNSSDKRYYLGLKRLSVNEILLPMPYSEALDNIELIPKKEIRPPRYTVVVKWGQRLEPWIVGINKNE
ncbi:DUF4824 family protein [Alteromonas sp. a30]|uniref:DUF4824 family protein n=1 Tax=Alteromonas sp. a30 TaxID=2730917 RepID=UPI00227DEA30|nr:DUF4824 family protein [Alteromonas sp. a30]MCY7295116.1 DUF4824 family protein [Alteromonas sp. a30]